MPLASMIHRWTAKHREPKDPAQLEAERLVSVWGDAAYDVARNLSVREGIGLVYTSTPGFWTRVMTEVGNRVGVPTGPARRSTVPSQDASLAGLMGSLATGSKYW